MRQKRVVTKTQHSHVRASLKTQPIYSNIEHVIKRFSFAADEQLIVMTLDFLTPSLVANSVIATQVLQAMCKFPDVQKKVQDEIDNVVGQGCLPRLDDRLKYVNSELFPCLPAC